MSPLTDSAVPISESDQATAPGEITPRLQFRYRPSAPTRLVKSAVRALQVLEFFDDVERPATVAEISEALDYPQSSTSILLQTLAACGYLEYYPPNRTYFQSARVALLGHKANGSFVTNGPILRLMEEISQRTRAIVILATRSGLAMKYINVIQAKSRRRPHIVLSSLRPLTESSGGHAIMSALSDAEVKRIVMRIRAEAQDPTRVPSPREMLEVLAQGRRDGYFFEADPVVSDGAMLAVLLPTNIAPANMSLIIGGPISSMFAHKTEILEILGEASLRHLGLDLVTGRMSSTARAPSQM
jgi:DNA-binding IclR family transcriptional regulator